MLDRYYYPEGATLLASVSAVAVPVARLDAATSGTAATLSYAVSAGSNRCLIIGVTQENAPTSDATVDYGGQAATQIASVVTGATTHCRVQLFRVMEAGIAAASGTTITATGVAGVYTVHAASYENVHQTDTVANFDTDSVDAATPNPLDACDITVPTSGLGVAIGGQGNADAASWGSPFTEQTDTQSSSHRGSFADTLTASGATSVDCTWTNQNRAAIVAAALNPVLSGGGVYLPSTDTYEDVMLALSPDAYWRLGDASGNATDSSGNARHLTAGGTPAYAETGWTTDGDDAILFDGSTDYFTASDAAWMDPGTNDFSVSWVMKLASWPSVTTSQIIGHDGNGNAGQWAVRLGTTANLVSVSVGTTSYNLWATSGLLQDGSFHHCTITFDRDGSASLYVDSEAAKTVNISGTSATDLSNAQALWLGSRDSGHYFPGTLDEVAFWNSRLLSAAELTTLRAAR